MLESGHSLNLSSQGVFATGSDPVELSDIHHVSHSNLEVDNSSALSRISSASTDKAEITLYERVGGATGIANNLTAPATIALNALFSSSQEKNDILCAGLALIGSGMAIKTLHNAVNAFIKNPNSKQDLPSFTLLEHMLDLLPNTLTIAGNTLVGAGLHQNGASPEAYVTPITYGMRDAVAFAGNLHAKFKGGDAPNYLKTTDIIGKIATLAGASVLLQQQIPDATVAHKVFAGMQLLGSVGETSMTGANYIKDNIKTSNDAHHSNVV